MAGEHVSHQALYDLPEAFGVHPLHGQMCRRPSSGAGDQILLHLQEQVGGARSHREFDAFWPAAGFHTADEQPIRRLDRRRRPRIRQSPAGRTGQAQMTGGGVERQGGAAPRAGVGQRTAMRRADHEAAEAPGGTEMDLGADGDILADAVQAPSRLACRPETCSRPAQPCDCSRWQAGRRLQDRFDAGVGGAVQPKDGCGG
jgi:hypothetical protein